jgi:filamentous hemagglutinin
LRAAYIEANNQIKYNNLHADNDPDKLALLQAVAEISKKIMDDNQAAYDQWGPAGTSRALASILITAASGTAQTTAITATHQGLIQAAWAMRQDQIADSKKFPGLCDKTGRCFTNLSAPSIGMFGDAEKVGGGRLDLDRPCDGNAKCRAGKNGVIIYDGNLEQDFKNNPKLISSLGCVQGMQCTSFAGISMSPMATYDPGDLFDWVIEHYAGPHDWLNSGYFYGPDGNIKPGLPKSDPIGSARNIVDVFLATPFAVSTMIPPELMNILINLAKEAK